MIKTVLAPNAPWPVWENEPKKPAFRIKGQHIKLDQATLDYIAKSNEEINRYKRPRERDKATGKFKSSNV